MLKATIRQLNAFIDHEYYHDFCGCTFQSALRFVA